MLLEKVLSGVFLFIHIFLISIDHPVFRHFSVIEKRVRCGPTSQVADAVLEGSANIFCKGPHMVAMWF